MRANKITLATFKSMLRKNQDIAIKTKTSFDGMTDCVQDNEKDWRTVSKEELNFENNHTLGIEGLWLVGGSRDYFSNIGDNEIEVYNCCGSCIIRFGKVEAKQEEVKTYPQVLEGQDINRFPPSKTILDEVEELSNMKLSSDCFETDEDDQDESEDMGNILENDYEQKSITELEMAKLIEEAHDRREVKVGDKARVQTLRNRMTFTGPRFVNEILTGTVKAINCHTLEFECNGQVHIIPRESVQDLIRI